MTKEECLKQIMEMEEFAFIKDIPTDKLWKLIFAINFVMGNEADNVTKPQHISNTFPTRSTRWVR